MMVEATTVLLSSFLFFSPSSSSSSIIPPLHHRFTAATTATATATTEIPPLTPGFQPSLFVFGLGYVGSRVAQEMQASGWKVSGTSTSTSTSTTGTGTGSNNPPSSSLLATWAALDVRSTPPKLLDGAGLAALHQATHVLVTIPPVEGRDMVADFYAKDLLDHCPDLRWLGYLSSTSVYGDCGGEWVTETAETSPSKSSNSKGQARVKAEEAWAELVRQRGPPGGPCQGHIFRLAGIYGPGRNALETLRKQVKAIEQEQEQEQEQDDGVATKKPFVMLDEESWVNRIHVDDIVRLLRESMMTVGAGAESRIDDSKREDNQIEIYNVADDRPVTRAEVFHFAARLLGLNDRLLQRLFIKKEVGGGDSASPSSSSSSRRLRPPENKRVSNKKMKTFLLQNLSSSSNGNSPAAALLWPSYEEGLIQLWQEMRQKM